MIERIGTVAAGFAKVAFARKTGIRSASRSRKNSCDLTVNSVASAALHRQWPRTDRFSPAEELRSPLRVASSNASTPYPTYSFRRAYLAMCANSLATSPCSILLWSALRGLTSLIRIEKAAFGSELLQCRKVSSLPTNTAKS